MMPTPTTPTTGSHGARPTVDRAVALIRRHFLNRTDLVASLDTSVNARPTPIKLTDVCGKFVTSGGDPLLTETRQQTRELRELNRGVKTLIEKQPRTGGGTSLVFT